MASKTILIVDDDSVFQTSLTEILNRAGYDAHGAADGRHAISLAETLGKEIDLIVLEMTLPDMSGVSVIEAIALRQKKIVKVITSSSVFSQEHLNTQTSFHAHAGIRKEVTGTPATAAKWLLTTRSLLGELAARKLAGAFDLVVTDIEMPRMGRTCLGQSHSGNVPRCSGDLHYGFRTRLKIEGSSRPCTRICLPWKTLSAEGIVGDRCVVVESAKAD